MQARALWAATLLGAALADAAGEPQLAGYLAFAVVSIAGVAVLGAIGEFVEARSGAGGEAVAGLRALVGAAGLVLAVVGSAARGPLIAEGEVPALASSAIGAALFLIVFDLVLAAAARPRATAAATARPRRRRPAERPEIAPAEDRRAA
jgi:hypothetical protein